MYHSNHYVISLFVLFTGLFTNGLYSQETPECFGNACYDELKMTSYPKDLSAEAVVLYDIGESRFDLTNDGFELIYERRTKVKILSKAGFKYAEIEIPFYKDGSRAEIIKEISGKVYNLVNDQIQSTAIDPKNKYVEVESEHWSVMKFAIPDVKEGSVFEIRYIVTSPFLFNLRNWEFQTSIPVVYSRYTTKMIPFYEYFYILQGASKLDYFQSYEESNLPKRYFGADYHDVVYIFLLKNIPAFRDESFITSYHDYIIKLDFQLAAVHQPNGTNIKIMSTWPQLIEDFLKEDSFGKYYKSSEGYSKSILDTLKLADHSAIEKATIINRIVKSNFNWNGRKEKLTSQSAKEFQRSKTGNSAEINLFLTALLKSAGLDANPVLISTRDHGKIKTDYPFQHFFNYVLASVLIDSNYYLLDATDPMSQFAEIPSFCFNDKGLLIKKTKGDPTWLKLVSTFPSSINYELDWTFDASQDSLIAKTKVASTGYDALDLRKSYAKDIQELKKDLNVESQQLSNLKVENNNELDNPFIVTIDLMQEYDESSGKVLIAPFSDFVMNDNPFKMASRTYPIDFTYQKERTYKATLRIPQGFKLFSKPEDLTINNKDILINYSSQLMEDKHLIINAKYVIKNDIYNSSSYSSLKTAFNLIINRFNEEVILQKL
ncbi:MAG TPA: hypothetical protein PK796_10140 [Bacteroidales bacterium]|jgi:hypothetical protein|nr:hypothetical protein [Bacteroidales bacterium]